MKMIPITLPEEAWQDVEPGTEALLDEWLAASGEAVTAGQSIAVVVMVKTTIEVATPVNGVIDEIFIAAGGTIAKGLPLVNLRVA